MKTVALARTEANTDIIEVDIDPAWFPESPPEEKH